jgi:hypothetical protein
VSLFGKEREMKVVRRTKINERFNPEEYGMIFCPDCSGSGRSFTDPKGANAC